MLAQLKQGAEEVEILYSREMFAHIVSVSDYELFDVTSCKCKMHMSTLTTDEHLFEATSFRPRYNFFTSQT